MSKSKITATRFYLQNINSDSDIHDSPYKRLFKLTHILSSAHLVAYIDGDNVEFRFMIKQGNNVLFKTIEHSKRKSDFIDFMTKALTIKSSEIQQAVSWIDVVRKEIGNASKNAFYTEIREGILNFNKELKKYISDDDFNRYASFQITNITCHNFDGTNIGLIFFNSNYYPIFNYNQPTANLLKQSYAYDLYNSLNELIENEKESRDKYEQKRDSMSAMDMTLLHYLKNTLKSKYGYMLNLDKSNSKSIELLKTNNEILVKRLNDYLSIYTTCQKNNELLCLSEVINRWNTKAEENENNEIKTVTIVKIENCDVRDKKIRGDINIFDLIFEEFILNATQRANTSESIKLSLDVNVEKEYVTFSIINENSTIPPDQRPVLGKKFISSSTKGGGIGFSIVQFLLKKIGAIENPNDKSLNFNIHYNDNEPISFKFQFLKKLI